MIDKERWNLDILSNDELNYLSKKIRARQAQLNEEAEAKLWPKNYDLYVHHGDESMYYDADKLGLKSDDAQLKFANCCYELCIELEVHRDGSTYALAIEGIPLTTKVKLA